MAERRNATETYVQTQLGLYVPKSLYDANTILAATTDDTPAALTVPASTFVGRKASGDISAMSTTEAAVLLEPKLPGHVWSYTQMTSPVTISSTTESAGTTVLSPAAFTPDGAAVMCTVGGSYILNPGHVSSNYVILCLFEGATELARIAVTFLSTAVVAARFPLNAQFKFTPTAASHTYKITGFRTNADGTAAAGAGGTAADSPLFVQFVKV